MTERGAGALVTAERRRAYVGTSTRVIVTKGPRALVVDRARNDSQVMKPTVTFPADLADLALAPVALAVSHRLEQLGHLTSRELAFTIAAGTDREPVPGRRGELLLDLLDRDLDLHHWTLSWCPSGLRLEHDGRGLTLGLAPTLRTYLDGDDAH